MRYRTLTAIGMVVALVVGLVARQVVYAVLAPGSTTDFVATAVFLGAFIGGLLGFVGIFRVREGKPFFNNPF
ncbi:MAG: hypothetical protein OXK82_00870 [Deltaproteobacteria bacterium]|nr:hypothetical protein [Deltaproteobacteria bacterium]MDE0341722.1 hypothetical protein [Deltaproteobacteria bacterium]